MKITTINREAMEALKPGDVIYFSSGGKAKIELFKARNSCLYPFIITYEGHGTEISYTVEGKVYGNTPHLLDIISIEKTQPELPSGFIPWSGGGNPAGCNGVEYQLRNTVFGNGYAPNLVWYHHQYDGDIIAYRVIPPKQEGELWCVVHGKDFPAYPALFSSKQAAINFAKSPGVNPLALFPAAQGTWKEGDGLELLEDRNGKL